MNEFQANIYNEAFEDELEKIAGPMLNRAINLVKDNPEQARKALKALGVGALGAGAGIKAVTKEAPDFMFKLKHPMRYRATKQLANLKESYKAIPGAAGSGVLAAAAGGAAGASGLKTKYLSNKLSKTKGFFNKRKLKKAIKKSKRTTDDALGVAGGAGEYAYELGAKALPATALTAAGLYTVNRATKK